MKTKYDWSNVPDDIETITTNIEGVVIGYESSKPMMTTQGWDSNYGYYYLHNQKPFKGNW